MRNSPAIWRRSARDQQQAAQLADAPPAAPSRLNRRSLLKWAAGTAAAGEAATLGYPMVAGEKIPAHGVMHSGASYRRSPAPPYRTRAGQSAGRDGRPEFRQLGAADADQARRRNLRGQPQYRPRAGLDLVLELRRLQSDLASPVRLPQRGPGQGLRMDQQHPGRQELADLRHPHQHRDPGAKGSTSTGCATTAPRWS